MFIQLMGHMGMGKTNIIRFLKLKVFPDYEMHYMKKVSITEAERYLAKLGTEGQNKYLIVFDDCSFIFTKSMQDEHNFDQFCNDLTDLRHIVAENNGMDADRMRIVVVFSHHYLKSVNPFLREAPVHFICDITSEEQKARLEGVFTGYKLNQFYRLFDSYIFSPMSRLDKKERAPVLVKIMKRQDIIWLGKYNYDLKATNKKMRFDTIVSVVGKAAKWNERDRGFVAAVKLFSKGKLKLEDIAKHFGYSKQSLVETTIHGIRRLKTDGNGSFKEVRPMLDDSDIRHPELQDLLASDTDMQNAPELETTELEDSELQT